jgi:hypothetical protein
MDRGMISKETLRFLNQDGCDSLQQKR